MFRLQNERFTSSAGRMPPIDPTVRAGAECLEPNTEFAANQVPNKILEVSRRKGREAVTHAYNPSRLLSCGPTGCRNEDDALSSRGPNPLTRKRGHTPVAPAPPVQPSITCTSSGSNILCLRCPADCGISWHSLMRSTSLPRSQGGGSFFVSPEGQFCVSPNSRDFQPPGVPVLTPPDPVSAAPRRPVVAGGAGILDRGRLTQGRSSARSCCSPQDCSCPHGPSQCRALHEPPPPHHHPSSLGAVFLLP